PGHSLGSAHPAPTFAPPMHRFPPQTAPLQSAFDAHALAVWFAHVSQKHFAVVKPVAVQVGLASLSVRDCAPVLSVSGMFSVAMSAFGSGGQSKLVLPNRSLVPFATHVAP